MDFKALINCLTAEGISSFGSEVGNEVYAILSVAQCFKAFNTPSILIKLYRWNTDWLRLHDVVNFKINLVFSLSVTIHILKCQRTSLMSFGKQTFQKELLQI